MMCHYMYRQFLGSPEFSGSNICIYRRVFNAIGGFRQPPRLGVDLVFCQILRNYLSDKKGKMKVIHTLAVETDVRHLTMERAIQRVTTHHEYYKRKSNKIKEI